MTIDSFSNWNGDEYSEKDLAEAYALLNPTKKSGKKRNRSVSDGSSPDSIRSEGKKLKSPKRISNVNFAIFIFSLFIEKKLLS